MSTFKINDTKSSFRVAPKLASCALAAALCAAGGASADPRLGEDFRSDNRELRAQLELLRKATSAFHSYDVAEAAGWNAVISPCVSSPAGAMGYHVANMQALDQAPFELSLLKPEVLLYAPLGDGSMEFLGVEYIVPHTLENASTPPTLMGQTFEYNPHQEIWALHVWTERTNPAGLFAPFNPDVECPED